MAVLKDLIVHGPSKFIGKTYVDTLEANSVKANEGLFTKLAAKSASANELTVSGLLDVHGELHTKSWSNSNIATVDGNLHIVPTVTAATVTGTITYKSSVYSMDLTGAFDTSTLTIGTTAGTVNWTPGSSLIVSGEVKIGNEWLPLGTLTCDLGGNAPLPKDNTSKKISLTSIKDSNKNVPEVLESIRATLNFSETSSSLNFRNIKIAFYSRKNTKMYPIGILLTAQGTGASKTFVDIYDGNHEASSTYGGLAEPVVRIGNLSSSNLAKVGNQTPAGWGIYTSNGYFSGAIAAKQGYIGDGTMAWTIGNEGDNRAYIFSGINSITTSGSTAGTYVGTDGISNYKNTTQYVNLTEGKITAQGADIAGTITAKSGTIGGWTIDDSYGIYTNSKTTAGSTRSGILIKKDGSIYAGAYDSKSRTCPFQVTSTGFLTAINGRIGKFTLSNTYLYTGSGSSQAGMGGNQAFWAGSDTSDSAPFRVSYGGALYATGAEIEGNITATEGTIGGCSISNGKLKIAAANIDSGTINVARIPQLEISQINSLESEISSAKNSANSFIYYTPSVGLKLASTNPSGTTANYVHITSTSISVINDSTHKSVLNSSGMQIYSGDATNAIAQFGSTITLGKTTQSYLNIYTKGTDGIEGVIDFYKGSTLIGTIESTYTSSTSDISLVAYHGSDIGIFSVGPTGADLWFGVSGESPISFGTTGTISANSYIESSNSNGSVRLVVDNGHRGLYDAGNSQWIIYDGASNYIHVNNNFGPGTNSTSTSTGYYLGWSNYRWRGVYSYSAPNSVSDRKDKDIIGSIDYAKDLIMKLKPIEYQWKNSDHNRIHLGFIAQEVAEVGKDLDKNLSIYEANYKNSEQKYSGEDVDDKELSWGMTYTELIAPMIKVIQEQEQRIQELEAIVKGGK